MTYAAPLRESPSRTHPPAPPPTQGDHRDGGGFRKHPYNGNALGAIWVTLTVPWGKRVWNLPRTPFVHVSVWDYPGITE